MSSYADDSAESFLRALRRIWRQTARCCCYSREEPALFGFDETRHGRLQCWQCSGALPEKPWVFQCRSSGTVCLCCEGCYQLYIKDFGAHA